MRLCTPLSLCLAAAALLPVAGPAHAQTDPACAASDNRAFPVTTRIHGGPGSYAAGGGYGTWYLDLTNTTSRPCAGIHPVVVLVDDKRALKPAQPRLEFYDGPRAHPVRFETTDENELVGPFADGFPGFTVAPGRTVTVRLRLAIAPDAVPNQVTANAAVVQRHEDDGDWVGQSNDYRFGIDTEPATPAERERDEPRTRDPEQDHDAGRSTPPPATSRSPEPRPDASASPSAPDVPLSLADELARTGLGPMAGVLTVTALLLIAAGTVLVRRRR